MDEQADRIVVENRTFITLFVRAWVQDEEDGKRFVIEVWDREAPYSTELPSDLSATIMMTPSIRGCFHGGILPFSFSHHVEGGLILQPPAEKEPTDDGHFAKVFRLLPVNN